MPRFDVFHIFVMVFPTFVLFKENPQASKTMKRIVFFDFLSVKGPLVGTACLLKRQFNSALTCSQTPNSTFPIDLYNSRNQALGFCLILLESLRIASGWSFVLLDLKNHTFGIAGKFWGRLGGFFQNILCVCVFSDDVFFALLKGHLEMIFLN